MKIHNSRGNPKPRTSINVKQASKTTATKPDDFDHQESVDFEDPRRNGLEDVSRAEIGGDLEIGSEKLVAIGNIGAEK